MTQAEVIKEYEEVMKDLPVDTQIAVALIKEGGATFLGLKKGEKGIEAVDNADYAFEIGSITKVFTGNILSQMVLEGMIGLDDLIQPFLPFRLLGDPGISLRHLAQHTSGLPKLPHTFKERIGYQKDNPYFNCAEEHFERYFTADLQMENLPGKKFLYSNLGMSLLSYIISRIDGRPYPEIVSERIFVPRGMRHSTFDHRQLQIPLVRGIGEDAKFCTPWDPGIYSGSLGIISTVRELSTFMFWQAGRGNKACRLQAAEEFKENDSYRSNLGWGKILVDPEKVYITGINGGTAGCGASLLLHFESGSGLIVLTNIYPKYFLEHVYGLSKKILMRILHNSVFG